jgi:hypothetical protein
MNIILFSFIFIFDLFYKEVALFEIGVSFRSFLYHDVSSKFRCWTWLNVTSQLIAVNSSIEKRCAVTI